MDPPPQNGCNDLQWLINALIALVQQHIAVVNLCTRALSLCYTMELKNNWDAFTGWQLPAIKCHSCQNCARHNRRMGCAAIIQRLRYAG